jgi:uncharacterized protein DUF6232
MTIHYRGPEVVITSQKFERRGPHPQCYRIDELKNVHVLQENLRLGRLLAGPAIGLLILAVVAALGTPDYIAAYLALAAGASSAITYGCVRLTPKVQELRATYRSHEVRLYASRNPEAFGQVRRGLTRALEQRDRYEEQYTQ